MTTSIAVLDKAERVPDPWFNPYRHPATERGFKLVKEVYSSLERNEARERARTKKDQQWFLYTLIALITDLVYHHLSGSPGTGLVVPRAKSALSGRDSRYHPPFFTRSFPNLLDELRGPKLNIITQRTGKYSGMPGQSKTTTIRAGEALVALIEKYGVTFEDLTLDDEEVIILKRTKVDYEDEGGRLEYKDTPTTERLRAEVRAINRWLEGADIGFDGVKYERPVDTRARRLFRYFANGRFDHGGRLFRGFWENLPKRARLQGISIEGERVVELDYAQLNPTLAYVEAGAEMPTGDAYTLPGLEQFREGVKKVFNAMLFDEKPRKSFPKGVGVLFPPGTKIRDVTAPIHEKHPKLVEVLSQGVGFRLMFLESEIMMAVLRRCRARGIVALPVFDAVIIKACNADEAKAVMIEQFRRKTGREIKVKLERG